MSREGLASTTMDVDGITARFDVARRQGERAIGALWAELLDKLGNDAASQVWLRLWSGLDASET